ncbi:MAG: patatin-like phospholipase family protein [Thiohalomonadales bacterium]
MNRFLAYLISTVLLFFSCTTVFSSTDQQKARRFSIAISGGASKGAYEAGLNWGLLKILQNLKKIDSSDIGDTRIFNAASFSGASAGSINTLLSALTWCSLPESENGLPNSIDSNIFRDVWLLPDVNRLLPATADSKYYSSNDALLSRYDLLQASEKLRKRWSKPSFRTGCRIPLGVSVTRVIPDELNVDNIMVRNQRMFIPFEARTNKDGSMGFKFDPGDYPALSDPSMILLPHLINSPSDSIDAQRINDALLASSAFPGGFGRIRLQYCKLLVNTSTKEIKSATPVIKEKIACPEGYELTEAIFADGGLFDNLPVGLARKLAEQHKDAKKNVLPATYIYLDPDRTRYTIPPAIDTRACASDKPPKACQTLEYSFFSEQALLMGALGTARKYELYRELTSKNWSLNLVPLSYKLAEKIKVKKPNIKCLKEIPFFDSSINCEESVRRAGGLLELAYTSTTLVINKPYSEGKLKKLNILYNCRITKNSNTKQSQTECDINVIKYRKILVKVLLDVIDKKIHVTNEFKQRIQKTKFSMHNDRILRVTDRGAPITGTLLSSFGAFLDLKFREYDYYVGVYDSIIATSKAICGYKFFKKSQKKEFLQCQSYFAKSFYTIIGINQSLQGRYLFARLAKWEFENKDIFDFTYTPMPEEDRDMRIIFDGLLSTLDPDKQTDSKNRDMFFTENEFFRYLKKENFQPTPTNTGSSPLLTHILEDQSNWTYEMTRRITTRLVYLEQQAQEIYNAREPDPAKREKSYSLMMGLAAHSLQTATYRYPDYTFTPSTSPENWLARNFIPYELAIDLASSDISMYWQPTWALTKQDLFSIRFGLGFVGGLIDSVKTDDRENYGIFGFEYSRQTDSIAISSWGITPALYHSWNKPILNDQDTLGGDIHVSFYKDRIRLGLGVRDVNEVSDTWFINIGLTDLPGMIYWLTR